MPARAAGYDPKKYAGTKLSILMTGDENDHRALGDLLPQLKEETGIKLEITSPALGALIKKTLQNLKAERSSFELIEYLGFLTTQQVGGGYFLQLNDLIANADETPPDWDFADFIPGALKNVGIYDLKTHNVGVGSDVYGIPGLHSGSVIYFYRKDLFDAAGLQPAKTWDDFKASAQKLHSGDVAGCSFIGANDFSLATVDWYTRFITTGGVLMTGDPNGKDFTPACRHARRRRRAADADRLAALCAEERDPIRLRRERRRLLDRQDRPDDLLVDHRGPDLRSGELAGRRQDRHRRACRRHPARCGRAIQGGWGVGIPKNVDPAKKAAAWRALTWITNKETNIYEIEKYQIDANRTSAFADPELIKKFPYLPIRRRAIAVADIIPTSKIDEFFRSTT